MWGFQTCFLHARGTGEGCGCISVSGHEQVSCFHKGCYSLAPEDDFDMVRIGPTGSPVSIVAFACAWLLGLMDRMDFSFACFGPCFMRARCQEADSLL